MKRKNWKELTSEYVNLFIQRNFKITKLKKKTLREGQGRNE